MFRSISHRYQDSLPVKHIRQMIEYVVKCWESRYIQVVETLADGQWHNYEVTGDEDEEPKRLTLIQLQRMIWKECKKTNQTKFVFFGKDTV